MSLRALWTHVHRWMGLTTAAFLFVTGLTGAVISWDHELDEVLNPHLTDAVSTAPPMSSLQLAEAIEARDPRVRVTYVPLAAEPGHSLAFGVDPRVDPETGRLHVPGYNQVFVDPGTGEVLGKREWGAVWPITRETLVSFLYKLHFSLHLPEFAGIDHWGEWLLGGIAIIWTLDCFVGFYLTLPRQRERRPGRPKAVERQLARGWWSRWKPSWLIRATGSGYRLNFDIHRAFGLWFWAVLLVVAFTAFSLNLYREVFFPLMTTVSEVTPTPFDRRAPTPLHEPMAPEIGYAQVIASAESEAARRGWADPAGDAFYAQNFGVYGVRFFDGGDAHGSAGVGPPSLYYDALDGRLLGDRVPWQGTAADIFVQAQFPLHSGRILGIPGRILISVTGLIVAALSVTGVVIWWRKRRARLARRRRRALPATGHTGERLPAE